MLQIDESQITSLSAVAAGILTVIALLIQAFLKYVKGTKAEKTEDSLLEMMHKELERMSKQNALLSEEIGKLQQELIRLNIQLMTLSMENKKLQQEVSSLNSEISRLHLIMAGGVKHGSTEQV